MQHALCQCQAHWDRHENKFMSLHQQGSLVCETSVRRMRGCHAPCWKALGYVLYVYLYPVVPAIAQHITNHRPAFQPCQKSTASQKYLACPSRGCM